MKKRFILIILILTMALFSSCSFIDEILSDDSNKTDESYDYDTDGLIVHFISVGQADSILIQQGSRFMLIDAADRANKNTVLEYLSQQGVDRLEYVIATHPHEDHIGGMDSVIENYDIDMFILPEIENTTATYERMLDAAIKKDMQFTAPTVGDTYKFGEAEFIIAAPNSGDYKSLNNWSVVIKFMFYDVSIFFAGDAESVSEKEMLDGDTYLKSDVLKVAHHGSNTSNSTDFLNAVEPDFCILTVASESVHNLPNKDAIERIKSTGAEIYRTDELGNIVMTTDGKTIEWSFSISK